ncbi:21647_t:CDS:1, partial [Gigaspora rosea]
GKIPLEYPDQNLTKRVILSRDTSVEPKFWDKRNNTEVRGNNSQDKELKSL